MTPESIRKAAAALVNSVGSFHGARSEGAALGRTLAAEVRGRQVASQQMNGAVVLDMEMELLKLAAGKDEFIAEFAGSALRELRTQQQKSG